MDSRLLISLVVDNSAAVQGEKFEKIKSSLNDFCNALNESEAKNIELEIICFDEFQPKVLKNFSRKEFDINGLEPIKMPFLGKALDIALTGLQARADFFSLNDTQVYKPWLFVLTNAYSFDDVDVVARDLKQAISEQKVLYMPFILSQRKIPDNVEDLALTKKFMRIKENSFDMFFKWFYDMAVKRATTPNGVPVKFERAGFEGWAIL